MWKNRLRSKLWLQNLWQIITITCLVINVSHLEVNNSVNINDIILWFLGLIENRITFHLIKEMAWLIEEKTFCVTLYLETKSLKTVQARHRRRFIFNNFPHKFQITRWVKKFKDTGTLIKSTKKGQKSTSGRKLTARSPENVNAVSHSVGRDPETLSRVGFFSFIRSQNLEEWPSVLPIQNPDQTNSHTKWHGKTCWDMPVVRKQDWRKSRFSSECVIQWWSSLLSIRPCQQQEICVLGISSTRWSPSETTALCKVHCVGCNIETLHNQTVLVLEWCWRDSNG